MICPKCGSEIEDGWEGACDCTNKKCEYAYKKGGTSYATIGDEWQARAEKAEGELKAIKARIDKNKINYIINHHLQKYNFNMGAFEPEPFIELVSNLIKQIGGEK